MKLVGLSLGVCALVAVAGAAPKHSKRVAKVSGPETGLVGVKLYDSNTRVLDLYGSPDQIEAISFGGTSNGGPSAGPGFSGGRGSGPGAPGGMPGMPGAPGRSGGSRGAPAASGADFMSPFDFGNEVLRQGVPVGPPGMQGPGGRGYPGAPGGPSYGPSGPGMPGGIPGAPGAPGGATGPGGLPSAGGGASERVTFTRWVYNRLGSKYGFIIDKSGRVVQIEAIGIDNAKVKTRRGVGFGTNFATIIRKYGNPDAYEIGGDNILVRYLTRHKVAFRLSRLGTKAPQTVTGVVVAAGKQ